MVDLIVTVLTIVVVLAAAAIIFVALNRLVDLASIEWQDRIRPWVFVGPALVFLGFGLVWPTVRTVYLSFRGGPDGENGFTFDNYTNVFTDSRYFSFNNWDNIFTSRLFFLAALLFFAAIAYVAVAKAKDRQAGIEYTAPVPSIAVVAAAVLLMLAVFSTLQGTIWNNLWWVVTVAGLSTLLGLMLAILADRSNGEKVAKSLIFMPVAISFVGAAVIWRYVYYRNTSREDIGLLNNVLTGTGLMDEPIDFYTSAEHHPVEQLLHHDHHDLDPGRVRAGGAVGGRSSRCRARPSRRRKIDGASELQSVWRVVIPQVWPTVVVVLTTLTVMVMKVFDLVKATTNGRSRTDVLANTMYENLRDANFTGSATFAVIIVVLVLPIVFINVRRHREASGLGSLMATVTVRARPGHRRPRAPACTRWLSQDPDRRSCGWSSCSGRSRRPACSSTRSASRPSSAPAAGGPSFSDPSFTLDAYDRALTNSSGGVAVDVGLLPELHVDHDPGHADPDRHRHAGGLRVRVDARSRVATGCSSSAWPCWRSRCRPRSCRS